MKDIFDLFTKNKASHFIILIGIITLFFSVFTFTYNPLKVSALEKLSVFSFFLGIGIIGIGILLILLDKKPKTKFNLQGKWEYRFEETDLEFSYKHGGIATIIQDGNKIKIDGFRRYMEWEDTSGIMHEKKINMHWCTSWGLIDEEGMLRYDYDMPISGNVGRIVGYVKVQLDKHGEAKPKSFEGVQCMLPPFPTTGPVSKWGTISYKKVEDIKPALWERLANRQTPK